MTRNPRADADIDPVSEVIVSGLQAAATLGATELRSSIEMLSQEDVNLRVREVALTALDAMNRSTQFDRTGFGVLACKAVAA